MAAAAVRCSSKSDDDDDDDDDDTVDRRTVRGRFQRRRATDRLIFHTHCCKIYAIK